MRERIHVTDERPQLVERRRVVFDPGAARGEHDREELADREQVDAVAGDERVEQVIHHLWEQLALVQAQHVGAELRVLDTAAGSMGRAVRDADDPVADVPLVVRPLVERA